MTKPKVMIGIPAYNGIVPEAMPSILGMVFRCGRDLLQYDFAVEVVTKSEQFRARNRLVDAAIGGGFEWLLMLDDDMIVPADLLARLLAHNKDVCGGLYYQRGGAYHPVLMSSHVHEDGHIETQYLTHVSTPLRQPGLHRVDIIGGGCMLFKVDVFRKLMPPYFEAERYLGTDINICTRLREAGVDIWCDTSFELGHIKEKKEIITSRSIPVAQREIGAINETVGEDALDYLCMLPEELEAAMTQASQREQRRQRWLEQDRTTWEGCRSFYQSYGNWHTLNLLYHNLANYERTKEWAFLQSEAVCGQGANLIDYGCGIGYTAIPLVQRFGHRVHAVDIAGAPTLEFLRYRMRKHDCAVKPGRHKGIWIYETETPAPEVDLPQPADGAFALSMIEHCWDVDAVLAWFARNVRPGGFLVCDYAVDRMEEEPQHLIRYDVATFEQHLAGYGFHVSPEQPWLFFRR